MTDLADRAPAAETVHPLQRVEREPWVRDSATVVAGSLAALWAMAVGVLALCAVVLVGWLTDGHSGVGAGQAVQVALQAYLLAHGGALTVSWGLLGLVPLGLTLLPGWLLVRAGAAVARRRDLRTLPALGEAVAAVTIVYGVLAVLLTGAADNAGVSVSPLRVGLGSALLAGLCSAAGAVRVSGLGRLLIAPIPGPRRPLLRALLGGLAALVGCGATIVAVALATNVPGYGELSRAVAPTWTGAVGLTVLGLIVVPNAVVYALAVGVGPGFAVGTGTTVSAFHVHLGSVPALPLLAALPDGQQPPLLALGSLLTPLIAGAVIGAVLVRRLDEDDDRGVRSVAGWAGAAGAVLGLGLGALANLAGGSLGSGQLAVIGPSGWQVAVAAALELGIVAAATAALLRRRTGAGH